MSGKSDSYDRSDRSDKFDSFDRSDKSDKSDHSDYSADNKGPAAAILRQPGLFCDVKYALSAYFKLGLISPHLAISGTMFSVTSSSRILQRWA